MSAYPHLPAPAWSPGSPVGGGTRVGTGVGVDLAVGATGRVSADTGTGLTRGVGEISKNGPRATAASTKRH